MRGERSWRSRPRPTMECAHVRDGTPTVDGRKLPPGWVLTTASGVCCLCDSQFQDELVLAWPSGEVPGGQIFVELRHVDAEAARCCASDEDHGRPSRDAP